MGKLRNSSVSWDSLKGTIYKGGGGPRKQHYIWNCCTSTQEFSTFAYLVNIHTEGILIPATWDTVGSYVQQTQWGTQATTALGLKCDCNVILIAQIKV